jgi:hypothetical protein
MNRYPGAISKALKPAAPLTVRPRFMHYPLFVCRLGVLRIRCSFYWRSRMSTPRTSSRMPAPQVEIGTLWTRALELEMDTRQLVLAAGRRQACGIRNARFHFAVPRPGTLYQAPTPHR